MKKVFAIVLVIAMVLTIGMSGAMAASRCARFTDANGDGVCDNCSYVDADGDGVCDNCPNGGTRPQDGTGARYGGRCGGRGQNCGRK